MKKRKHKLLKIIFIFIFMLFICYKTINYLYKNNPISSEDYIDLLLSDTYENNFYSKIVNLFSKNFNPTKMIELPTIYSKNVSSTISPVIYLINTKDNLYYANELNMKGDAKLSTYLLNSNLNKLGVNSVYDINLFDESIINNKSIEELINNKLNSNNSIKYVIDIGIKNNNELFIEPIIYLYMNKNNVELMKLLYKKIPNSKLYYEEGTYNHIDIGSNNNSIGQVISLIKILSTALKEVTYGS